jgi:hypothetical protein
MTFQYRRIEIQEVLDAGPHDDEDWFRLQISGKHSTKHLNLTPVEVAVVRDLLTEDSELVEHIRYYIGAVRTDNAENLRHNADTLAGLVARLLAGPADV